jgi:hypothetical protein
MSTSRDTTEHLFDAPPGGDTRGPPADRHPNTELEPHDYPAEVGDVQARLNDLAGPRLDPPLGVDELLGLAGAGAADRDQPTLSGLASARQCPNRLWAFLDGLLLDSRHPAFVGVF